MLISLKIKFKTPICVQFCRVRGRPDLTWRRHKILLKRLPSVGLLLEVFSEPNMNQKSQECWPNIQQKVTAVNAVHNYPSVWSVECSGNWFQGVDFLTPPINLLSARLHTPYPALSHSHQNQIFQSIKEALSSFDSFGMKKWSRYFPSVPRPVRCGR